MNVINSFKTTLSASCTSSQNTLILSSVLTKDNHTIAMADLGAKGYLVLEPGTSKEEIITFTGITGNTLTGVTRGLAFYGNSEANVPANSFAHQSGSIVIMSNVNYVYKNFVDKDSDETVGGKKTFSTYPEYSTPNSLPTLDGQLSTKKYVDGVAIAGAPDSSTTVKGIVKMSTAPVSAVDPIAVGNNDTRVPTQGENDALVGTVGTPSTTNKYVTNDDTTGTGKVLRTTNSYMHFGGTGSNGSLAISSGTTTIDLASARVKVLNYTSISITGTGKLAFTNPNTNGTIIIIKSQGDVTLTSSQAPMIDCSGLGAAGIPTATINGNTIINGATGNKGYGSIWSTNAGVGSTSSTFGPGGAASSTLKTYEEITEILKLQDIFVGASGGSGYASQIGGTTGTVGASGAGGGALIIECAGALNFTTANGISVAGKNAGNSTTGNASLHQFGGSGGGAGGYARIIYNTLTSSSGTVTTTGGTGGIGVGVSGSVYGAGGGASGKTAGNDGTNAAIGTQGGGNGAVGFSTIQANEF